MGINSGFKGLKLMPPHTLEAQFPTWVTHGDMLQVALWLKQ